MGYNPEIHHRRSIRLKGYDYSQNGYYFVTICSEKRQILFENESVKEMITKWWHALHEKFPYIRQDEFIVMPNHVHGIIYIVGANQCVRPNMQQQDKNVDPQGEGRHIGLPLHRIIQWFKTMTTNEYIKCVNENEWKPFHGKFWQRNYYERIILSDVELYFTREYIKNNPINWSSDENNPANFKGNCNTNISQNIV